jgi:hypothetical protein
MKKLLTACFFAAALVAFSCNPKDDNTKDKEKISKDDDENKGKDEDESSSGSDLKKAAAGYCDCFNESYGNIDPKLKRIIIKAGKSDDPRTTLQNEMMKIDDEEEKQKMAQQMQQFSDESAINACTKKISKKYDLNEEDPKVQKKILAELEDNGDCELVAALMQIGLKEGDGNKRKTNDEE